MTSDTLNSDPLGAKGESRFQEICEDASLICNKSTRDRSGWDYIVEFQFDGKEDAHRLDSRSAPISCHVQVKTLLTRSDRFKVRLSSAERLAKEIKPAFIYVFKVQGTEITEAYLIHIREKPLERILKRLREAARSGKEGPAINKRSISFSPFLDGTRIDPTGEALRVAIQEACGPDIHGYTVQKALHLRQLGFEPFPVKGTFRFRGLRNVEEMIDVVLGIQRNVEIEHLKLFEVRFGIPLALREFTPATHLLSIDPKPIDTCTVAVRNDGPGLPTVFDAELIIPPILGLPRQLFKLLVRSPWFSLLVPFQGQLSFWFPEDIRSQKHPPERWVDLANLLMGLAEGKAKIEIRANNRPDYIEFNVEDVTAPLDLASCKRWLTICEYALSLIRSAGVSREAIISIDDIDESGNQILEAYAWLNGGLIPLSQVGQYLGPVEVETGLSSSFSRGVDRSACIPVAVLRRRGSRRTVGTPLRGLSRPMISQ